MDNTADLPRTDDIKTQDLASIEEVVHFSCIPDEVHMKNVRGCATNHELMSYVTTYRFVQAIMEVASEALYQQMMFMRGSRSAGLALWRAGLINEIPR